MGDSGTAYLWPCNVQAWQCWCDVQHRWVHSASGHRTGLHWPGVQVHLDEIGLTGDERRDVYKGLCAAERATLEVWAEQAAAQQQ